MSTQPIDEDHMVGLSALLFTLRSHTALHRVELLEVCSRYPLRAGAVPWASALAVATEWKLVEIVGATITLSASGHHLSLLVDDDMEPSEQFAGALTILSIARSASRFTLAQARLTGTLIEDPKGAAAAVLQQLTEAGVVSQDAAAWQLDAGEFSPLLIGLLMGSPKGTQLTSDVGKMGEQLTLIYCRDNGGDPFHASVVSDAFGFDVLCRGSATNVRPSVAVEAKATTGTGPFRFFVSRHELRVARMLGARYCIEVWGAIDVTKSVPDNYTRLRGLGFPRLVTDPYHTLYGTHPGLFDGLAIGGGAVSADTISWEVA